MRNRHLAAVDTTTSLLSPLAVYALRFAGARWTPVHLQTALIFGLVCVPVCVAIYSAFGLYSRLWRYASVAEMQRIVGAGLTAAAVCALLGGVVLPGLGALPSRVPLLILFTNSLVCTTALAGSRLLVRIGGLRGASLTTQATGRRVLIAGAGVTGQMIVRELHENGHLKLAPVGFVDDDATKHGLHLAGLPVYGSLSDIATIVREEAVDEVVIAMPTASGSVIRRVLEGASEGGAAARTVPALRDILSGRVRVSALREVEIDDLLRRAPVNINLEQVRTLAEGRTILVTGAGGSIGSELARQLAALAPAKLLLLGHGENPIFHVVNELRADYPRLDVVPVIADIRDRRRIFDIFRKHRPQAVFHAAAHKHVPLMEENVYESVTNNVQGTRNVLDAAAEIDVERFVLISSDKAVRPTSVMGATKRIAEHVVREAALSLGRNYVAVRFGNVLGSEGSVVPTFVKQIRAGGPVTVTHPEMTRYFMTISEAVQLVLQAGALGRGGELFMLDMGEPVRIVDLATDLIRLSGLEVGVDVDITYTGIRPGEKLYEEMFFDHEETTPTAHPKVLCARDALEPWEKHMIDDLIQECMDGATDDELRALIKSIVPDFSGCGTAGVATPPHGVVAADGHPRSALAIPRLG